MRALLLACLLAAAAPALGVPHYDPPAEMPGVSKSGPREDFLDNATMACLILPEEDCARSADAARMINRDARNVRLAPPLFGVGQRFDALFGAYPRGSVQDVLEMIGHPTQTWIKNTCAIRVSYAMNHSGVPQFRLDRSLAATQRGRIEYISHGRTPSAPQPPPNAYIFRVTELANYMLQKYGKPQVWAKKTDNPRAAVHGKKGIILFVVSGWSDATGHFDVWNGQDPAGSEYFDKASDVFLWE